jgi:hypothetical protein
MNPSNYISIVPVSVWTASGTKSATQFEVRYINYNGTTAVADCHLWTSGPDAVEVGSQLVNATEEQCANWTDDADFYAVLATNAGLTPQ